MCGILGGFGLDRERVSAGLAEIRHRGPDAQALAHDPASQVTLGHARLAIIDLDPRSNQPMTCARTGNKIIFNGEIYNFRAVRHELDALGWSFRTTSDTEVLLAAYAQWGLDALPRLNGMFAFVIHDVSQRHLVLARDRIGKKPLYYAQTAESFVFASELKALIAAEPRLPRTIDDLSIRRYLALGYIPGERSVYSSVQRLLPGHAAVYDISRRRLSVTRYWQLQIAPAKERQERWPSIDEAADALDELLTDAVRIRLESDVPVGAFLSGGLDSSLVTAIAAKQQPGLVTYTASFDHAEYDESAQAAAIAKWCGVENVRLPIEPPSPETLRRLARQFDEPLGDGSLVPTYLVSRAIAEHAKVALSGDGGDELFAGYPIYRAVMGADGRTRVPRGLRRLAGSAYRAVPVGVRGRNYLRRLGYDGVELFRQLRLPSEESTLSPFTEAAERRWGLAPDEAAWRPVLDPAALDSAWSSAQPSPLLWMTGIDFSTYLPDDILVKVDRATMLASLEARAPLLDYRIAELAFSLPDAWRLTNGSGKQLLKRVARRYLPPDYPYDRKQGFSIPEAAWFRTSWSGLIRETAAASPMYLSAPRVEQLLAQHQANAREHQLLLRTLMLGWFLQHYGEGEGHAPGSERMPASRQSA
jgi:asparagine synthase (glutamine-hydrolysing)